MNFAREHYGTYTAYSRSEFHTISFIMPGWLAFVGPKKLPISLAAFHITDKFSIEILKEKWHLKENQRRLYRDAVYNNK
jgi:hypothetical protein